MKKNGFYTLPEDAVNDHVCSWLGHRCCPGSWSPALFSGRYAKNNLEGLFLA
jgi:hypothetical protein